MNSDNPLDAIMPVDEFESLKRIIDCLRPLDDEGKIRLLRSVITFLRLDASFNSSKSGLTPLSTSLLGLPQTTPSFTERTEMSPKQFMNEKQPANDLARVVCLAHSLQQ